MSEGTWRQAFDLLCDEQIGYGMSRKVFSSKILPDCVIKVEEAAGRFQNIVEWETWNRVKGTEHSRWFAACRWISPNGAILIMERTRPPAPGEFLDRMPAYLCDFKRTNYGMARAEGRHPGEPGKDWLVCHDYGTNLLFENGMTKRMHKAEWWDA
ncbi:hypothetical protein SAMN05216359_105288 [Roseateles sp. YR242]|uniref:hypothetical protein n=1 Tax=Roseateles sp. YR242 TaxID=1855305 RepID=UPI0008B0F6C3|nr:hypothetical protein [Roseateles sp. YR242]SEL12585.1 hypothetical protein SAMN05216359_105288 [Roseateles sp. YR242]